MKLNKNFSLKTIFCTALLVCLFGMMAQAQYTIMPASGFCMTHTPGGTSPTYTFTATGSHTQGTPVWSVRGDLQIVSQSSSPVQVVVRSTDFGKGRITLAFNQGTGACSGGQTTSIDVFKTFAPPGQIVGPSCVRPGELVTFSVPPVISSAAQINAEIGVDTYQWRIDGVPVSSSAWWPTSGTYTSGDGSSVTLRAPANLSGNPVLSVSIGTCNTASPLSLTLSTKANVPVFSVNLPPTCVAVGSTSTFLVSVINEPGVTYTWTVTPGWSVSAPVVVGNLNQVTVTPGSGTGEITVVAKASNASCESSVSKATINRQLIASSNTISGGTSCLTVGTAVGFSLTGAPAGGTFEWTAPSGWTPATATGTSASFTPSASAPVGGQITVKNAICPAGVITTTPVVSNNQGLNFVITNLGCGLFRVNATGFIRTGSSYAWSLDGVQIGTSSGNDNTFTFDPWTGVKTVSVRITKAAPDCLLATATLSSQDYNCSGLRSVNTSAESDGESVVVYPNPTRDQVTLTLPNDDAVKQILLEDQYGKVHRRFNTVQQTLTLDVSTLQQGLYMITVKTGKQTVTRKLKLER